MLWQLQTLYYSVMLTIYCAVVENVFFTTSLLLDGQYNNSNYDDYYNNQQETTNSHSNTDTNISVTVTFSNFSLRLLRFLSRSCECYIVYTYISASRLASIYVY